MFCEKKNLSVRRKIFKVWRGEKNVSVEFRVFGKKEEFWEKIKVFLVEILLSSCSLVNLQVKVTERKWWKFSEYFSGGCLKLKLRCAKKIWKSGIFVYWVRTHWLVAMLWNMAKREKWNFKFIIKKEMFCKLQKKKFWVWVTPLVGRHVVNESKVA